MKKRSEEYKHYSEVDYNQEQKKKVLKHPLLKGASKKDLKRGIIYSEVLGKPKGW
ncbi:hypothetical protein QBE53_01550 [Vallitaleaceae bacterium 9-2]